MTDILPSRPIKSVTRNSLAAAVTKANGLPRREASELVGEILSLVSETLINGEAVALSGFGKFVVMERAPRQARNVHENRAMILGSRRVVSFKPGAGLLRKRTLNATE